MQRSKSDGAQAVKKCNDHTNGHGAAVEVSYQSLRADPLELSLASSSGVNVLLFECLKVFGRPFVKRFALCYRTVVCLSCL